MLIQILAAALIIMSASLIGVAFVHHTAHDFLKNRLAYLVSFSAGVFLVTAGALLLEALELFASPLTAVAWVVAGYIAAWVIHFLLPESHHHHDPSCTHGHGGARRLIVGDAIHNIGDGIMLVPAFLASPALGLAVTASVFIHELLQEVSEFFVLKQAGYSTKKALGINFLVSGAILIGVGISYFATSALGIEKVLLALSAGFFINVVVHDLLPTRRKHETGATLVEHVLVLVVGVLAMASINTLLGDNHIHGDDHTDHAEEEHELHDDHKDEEPHEHTEAHHDTDHDLEDHSHDVDHDHDHAHEALPQ